MNEEKKDSLWSLQNRLVELEDDINADETDLSELIGEIADKVDGIKYVIDIFEKEAERFKQYKEQMAERQKSLEKAAGRLKSYVVKCLESHGSTFEKGNIWTVKIREFSKIDMFRDAPDAADVMNLGLKYNVIRTKYEWDKTALKELLSDPAHDMLLDEYGRVIVTKSIQFGTVNVARKKEKVNEQ